MARIEEIAARAWELVAQRDRMQGDLQGLDQGFPDFTGRQGRRLGFALLSLVCVPFSAGIDWGLISTPVEALLTILGLPSGWLSRILAALSISGILYALGAKYAVARHNREPTGLLILVALTFVIAVGGAFWATLRAAEQPEVLGLLGLGAPIFAFIAGAGLPEATDYLGYLTRRRSLSRAIRSLEREYLRLGGPLMRQFVELRRIQDTYRRRFGEELIPELSESAQRLFEELAIRAPGPRIVVEQVGSNDNEAGVRPGVPRDGRPDDGPEPPVVFGKSRSAEDYLRSIIYRQSLADDSALRP